MGQGPSTLERIILKPNDQDANVTQSWVSLLLAQTFYSAINSIMAHGYNFLKADFVLLHEGRRL